MPALNIWIPTDEEKAEWKAEAARRGVTLSELIRWAVRKVIAKGGA